MEAKREVAHFKEELEILEKKHLQLQTERDQLDWKCRDLQVQMVKQNEAIVDKDDKIEELNATKEILTSGKNFIKKSYDALQNKLRKIEQENYIIPKSKEEEKKGPEGAS